MKRLTKKDIVSKMSSICDKHRITLVLNDPDIEHDNGLALDASEIHMSRTYTSNQIMLAIFFHELSHILITRRKSKKYRKLSIFREETLAWCLAMEYQATYFGKSFSRSQGKFMLECLGTYSKHHYDFTKSYAKPEV